MKVLFHPDFPRDVRKFKAQYDQISEALGIQFLREITSSIEAVKDSPTTAGHFLNFPESLRLGLRRKNLRAFPFFILYGFVPDQVIFGAIIPTRSDPLTWLGRFSEEQ